jgi:hypothetical protein
LPELVSEELKRLRAELETLKETSAQAIESQRAEIALANARAEHFRELIRSEMKVTDQMRTKRDEMKMLLALATRQNQGHLIVDCEPDLEQGWDLRYGFDAEGRQVVSLINTAKSELVRSA